MDERVALAPSVTRDDIITAAYNLDWLFERKATDANPVDTFLSDDEKTQIDVVHDDVVKLDYCVVRGDDVNVKDVVSGIRESLETVSSADAVKAFKGASSTPDKVSALYLLGVASGDDPTNDAVATFKRALSDEEEDIRAAAIVAIGYVGGSELRQALEETAENDESEGVRKDARLMLEGLDKQAS
jgi:hypothetical protein